MHIVIHLGQLPGEKMMDSLKKRIINCIKENQPVTTDTIHQKLNVSRNAVRTELAKLRELGAIHSQVAIGHFASQEDFNLWLENGGREYMTARGTAGNKRSQEMRRRAGTVRQKITNGCRTSTSSHRPTGAIVVNWSILMRSHLLHIP